MNHPPVQTVDEVSMVSQANNKECCPRDGCLVALYEAVGQVSPAEDGSEALSPPLGEMHARS